MSGLTKQKVKASNCKELLPNDDGSLNVKIIESVPVVVTGPVTVAEPVDVTVLNPVTEVTVLNPVTSVTVQEPLDVQPFGTPDGDPANTPFYYVNNLRQQILATHDRQQAIVYADFGTINQRVTQINYSSALFPGVTARKTITYTLVSGRYRRDSINWTIV